MSNPRFTHIPREDVTPESERATLAAVYAYIIECRERKKAAGAGHGEVATEVGDAQESAHESPTKGGGC